MNETPMYGYGEAGAAPASPAPGPGGLGYKFSPDELRVLGECNSESFFQRSLPLGTLMGLTTFGAVQQGRLRPNARFGAWPKVTLAVLVGYFVGKLSYQEACAQKLMKLPGSYIGQLLREKREEDRRGGGPRTTGPAPPLFGAKSGDIYSDAGPGSSLDLDTDRPLFDDDAHRPDLDLSRATPDANNPPRSTAGASSYDELRARNRGQFTDSRRDVYKVDPSEGPTVRRPAAPAPAAAPSHTNQYGDVVD